MLAGVDGGGQAELPVQGKQGRTGEGAETVLSIGISLFSNETSLVTTLRKILLWLTRSKQLRAM